jgi:hypothetical protein
MLITFPTRNSTSHWYSHRQTRRAVKSYINLLYTLYSDGSPPSHEMDPTDPLEFTFLASILPLLPILIAIPLALYTRYLLLPPSPSSLPPGPSAHFLWGNTFPPHAWLQMQRWSETYGEIFTVYNGIAPCVVVAGYEAAMEILERGAKDTSDRPVVSSYPLRRRRHD